MLKYVFKKVDKISLQKKKVDKIKINVTVNGPKFQIIQKFRQDDGEALILK